MKDNDSEKTGYQVEPSKNPHKLLSRLKYLGPANMSSRDVDIDDLVYNLNCLIGYFNAIEHGCASKTVWCAEQAIKAAFKFNDKN